MDYNGYMKLRDALRGENDFLTRVIILGLSEEELTDILFFASTFDNSESGFNIVNYLLTSRQTTQKIKNETFINAIFNGNDKIAFLLLKYGADINAKEGDAICRAAENGDINTVKLLIQHGADVNARDGIALTQASFFGHTDVVKLLLKHGSVISEKSLCLANMKGHGSIVRLLVRTKIWRSITFFRDKT